MSHVEKSGQRFVEKEQNDWLVIDKENQQKTVETEKVPKINAVSKKSSQEYFDRMVNNSIDKNLAFKVKQDEYLESGNWENVTYPKVSYPVQKLPVAVNDRKFGSSEEDEVKKAKKTFRNADLCTVRERHCMTEYFRSWKNGEPPMPKGEDEPNNKELREYVNSILKVELGAAMFTDDYLSQHMHELYDYSMKLIQYGEIKGRFPKFFANIPLERRMALETLAEMGQKLNGLLTQHMELHGLTIEDTEDGRTLLLRKESENKTVRHRERDAKKSGYENELKKFYINNVINKELRIGEQISKENVFDTDRVINALEEKMNKNPEIKELYAPEIASVMDEVRSSLAVRDELLERQRELVREFRESKDATAKKNASAAIRRMNSRILIATRHVDNYREYMRFLAGETYRVPASVAEFLVAEKHDDLIDIIDFKMSADFINDSVTLNSIVIKEKTLKDLKNRKDKAKGENKGKSKTKSKSGDDKSITELDSQIAELEKEIRESAVYVKVPLSAYNERFREYRKIKNKKRMVSEKVEEFDKKKENARAQGDEIAKKYGLVPRGGDRIFGALRDSFKDREKPGDGGDLTFMYLACSYVPGPNTTKEQKNEIIEKGIKPILSRMTSKNAEDIEKMGKLGDVDYSDHEFWENESLAKIGHTHTTFTEILRNYDVPLKDEEYDRLVAYSLAAQILMIPYKNAVDGVNDPKGVLFNDKKVSDNILNYENGLIVNVYSPFMTGSGMTAEMKKVYNRYSKETLGFGVDSIDRMGKPVKASVAVQMSNNASMAGANEINKINNYTEIYEGKLAELKAKDKNAEEIKNEREEMLSYFPQYGDKELNIRLHIKNQRKDQLRGISHEKNAKWKKAFGGNSEGGADIRSFRCFLKPVKVGKSGSISPDYIKNREYNDKFVDDYTSEDEQRRNKALYRIGKEMLKIRIIPEMLTFDYMKEHFIEVHDMLQKIHGFQNISKDYPDFFESDIFTGEERDYLRQNFLDSEVFSSYVLATNFYCGVFGINGDGNDVAISDEEKATKESRLAWGNRRVAENTEIARQMFEDKQSGIPAEVEKDLRRKELYNTKGDDIRKVSVLHAKVRAELTRLKRHQKQEEENYKDGLPGNLDQKARKSLIDQKHSEIENRDKDELNRIKEELKYADELKRFIYEDTDKLSPGARLFASEHGVLSFSGKEINQARADLDMSIDMDLEETDQAELKADGLHTAEEEYEEATKKAEYIKLREQWDKELIKEDMEAGDIHDEDLYLLHEENKQKDKPQSQEEKQLKQQEDTAGLQEKEDTSDKEKDKIVSGEKEEASEEKKAEEKAEEEKAEEEKKEEKKVEKEKTAEEKRIEAEKKAEEEFRAKERAYIEGTDVMKLQGRYVDDYRTREMAEAEKLFNEAMKKRGEEGDPDSDEPLFEFNKKKYINPNTEKAIKEINENLEFGKKTFLQEDYPDNLKAGMEQIIRDAGFDVPEEQEDFGNIMGKYSEDVYWFEKGARKNDSFWKKDVPSEVRQAYNWLRGYYRANDMGSSLNPGDIPVLKMPKYKIKVNYNKNLMEKQDTNNCWCCAGSAIYNKMLINKIFNEAENKGKKEIAIKAGDLANQYQIRGYQPEYKNYDEENAKFKGKVDKNLFEMYKKKTELYAGPKKTKVGNIFEMGDFFLDKAKDHDFILNRMTFNIPNMKDTANKDRNSKIYNNMKVNFLNQVKAVLDTNNVVACLSYDAVGYAHYRTITGIDGEKITYYDSGTKGELTGSWDTFLNTVSHVPTELTWFSPMKKPEELTAEYSNLTYDKEKGFDVKSFRAESALNVAQTKGVCVGADTRKMGKGMDGIEKAIYIPKNI